jgi:cell division protein FtsB
VSFLRRGRVGSAAGILRWKRFASRRLRGEIASHRHAFTQAARERRFMNFRRSVAAFYALLFVALTLFAGLFFVRTYEEMRTMREREEENRRQLAELKKTFVDQKVTLERLNQDPAFVERVIRERLGYARPDETVIRFDQ